MSKIYIQFEGEKDGMDLPITVNCYDALRGFQYLGYDVVPFHNPGGIDLIEDLSSDTIVHGYIGAVLQALKKLGVEKPMPVVEDYPEELVEYLGRKIWLSNMETIRSCSDDIFIKPLSKDQKLFTGHVRGPIGYLAQTAAVPDDTEIQCSEPVLFDSEYRVCVLDREILGIQYYKGDFRKYPNIKIIEDAIKKYTSGPISYTIDFGVSSDGRTLLVECNDAFSFGCYGLHPVKYAHMIEARWQQMTGPSL